jgi:hypothetical protein
MQNDLTLELKGVFCFFNLTWVFLVIMFMSIFFCNQ